MSIHLTDLRGCRKRFSGEPFSRYCVYWEDYYSRYSGRRMSYYRACNWYALRCGDYSPNSWYNCTRVHLCRECLVVNGLMACDHKPISVWRLKGNSLFSGEPHHFISYLWDCEVGEIRDQEHLLDFMHQEPYPAICRSCAVRLGLVW